MVLVLMCRVLLVFALEKLIDEIGHLRMRQCCHWPRIMAYSFLYLHSKDLGVLLGACYQCTHHFSFALCVVQLTTQNVKIHLNRSDIDH